MSTKVELRAPLRYDNCHKQKRLAFCEPLRIKLFI